MAGCHIYRLVSIPGRLATPVDRKPVPNPQPTHNCSKLYPGNLSSFPCGFLRSQSVRLPGDRSPMFPETNSRFLLSTNPTSTAQVSATKAFHHIVNNTIARGSLRLLFQTNTRCHSQAASSRSTISTPTSSAMPPLWDRIRNRIPDTTSNSTNSPTTGTKTNPSTRHDNPRATNRNGLRCAANRCLPAPIPYERLPAAKRTQTAIRRCTLPAPPPSME